MKKDIITLTSQAQERIQMLMQQEQGYIGVRFRVIPKGCSGMSYEVEKVQKESSEDTIIKSGSATLFIDKGSIFYLLGTTVDFVQKDAFTKMFVFHNPNQVGMCACGESVMLEANPPAPAG